MADSDTVFHIAQGFGWGLVASYWIGKLRIPSRARRAEKKEAAKVQATIDLCNRELADIERQLGTGKKGKRNG